MTLPFSLLLRPILADAPLFLHLLACIVFIIIIIIFFNFVLVLCIIMVSVRLVSDVDRAERFRLTLRFFDDVLTAL